MPNTEKNKIDLSNIDFFFNADTIPNTIPKIIAKIIELRAKIKVTGKISNKMELTGFPIF